MNPNMLKHVASSKSRSKHNIENAENIHNVNTVAQMSPRNWNAGICGARFLAERKTSARRQVLTILTTSATYPIIFYDFGYGGALHDIRQNGLAHAPKWAGACDKMDRRMRHNG